MIECHLQGDNVVEMNWSDKVTADDFKRVTPLLEGYMKKMGRLKFLIDVKNLKGLTPGGLFQDIKFDLTHLKNVGDTAIVGDSKSQQILSGVIDKIFPAEVKYFEDKNAANQWLHTLQ